MFQRCDGFEKSCIKKIKIIKSHSHYIMNFCLIFFLCTSLIINLYFIEILWIFKYIIILCIE